MALKQEKAFRQLYFELFKKITKSQKLDCMPHCLIASLTTVVILETEQCLIWLQFYITTSNSPWDVPFGYSNKFYLSILLPSIMLFFFFIQWIHIRVLSFLIKKILWRCHNIIWRICTAVEVLDKIPDVQRYCICSIMINRIWVHKHHAS